MLSSPKLFSKILFFEIGLEINILFALQYSLKEPFSTKIPLNISFKHRYWFL